MQLLVESDALVERGSRSLLDFKGGIGRSYQRELRNSMRFKQIFLSRQGREDDLDQCMESNELLSMITREARQNEKR